MDVKEEFHSEPLLVVGRCLAGRVFRAHSDGVLTGLVYRQPWAPGINEAMCPYSTGQAYAPDHWREPGIGHSYFYGHEGHKRSTPHKPGAMKCSCGFWLYHDLAMSAEWAKASGGCGVVGLVHATGTMTRGTKGYRAQRAQIIALVAPLWAGWDDPAEDEPAAPSASWWDNVVDLYRVPIYTTLDAAVVGVKSRSTA